MPPAANMTQHCEKRESGRGREGDGDRGKRKGEEGRARGWLWPHLQLLHLVDDLGDVGHVDQPHARQHLLLLREPRAELVLRVAVVLPPGEHLLQQQPVLLDPLADARPALAQRLQLLLESRVCCGGCGGGGGVQWGQRSAEVRKKLNWQNVVHPRSLRQTDSQFLIFLP